MSYIVQTRKLSKQISKQPIVSNVDMHVSRGEVYGIVGPNGAGKTSLFHLLTGLWKPSGGEIEIFGERISTGSYAHFQQIGSLIGTPRFHETRTGLENLQLHSEYMGFYDQRHILETIEQIGIQDQIHKPVHSYSAGIKQKLGLVRAIALKPQLLLLDEPGTSLDAEGIKELRHIIRNLNQQYGITVIVSSHHMKELEQVADTIGMLDNGKLIKELSLQEIKQSLSKYVELQIDSSSQAAHLLENVIGITNFHVVSDTIIRIYNSTFPTHEIIKRLILNDVPVHEIRKNQNTLEDYVLQIYKGAELV